MTLADIGYPVYAFGFVAPNTLNYLASQSFLGYSVRTEFYIYVFIKDVFINTNRTFYPFTSGMVYTFYPLTSGMVYTFYPFTSGMVYTVYPFTSGMVYTFYPFTSGMVYTFYPFTSGMVYTFFIL